MMDPPGPALIDAPRICDDMRAWCAEHPPATYREVYAGRAVERKPPRTAGPSLDAVFKELYRVESPARGLVCVPNARLVGFNGLVILPDDSYVGELIAITPAGRRRMLEVEQGFDVSPPPPSRVLQGSYYPIFVVGWGNYYHWNHDCIMRLCGVIDLLPPDVKFIVPARIKPFQLETLRLLGISPERQVPFDGKELWQIEQLYFSTPIFKTQIDRPEPMQWFRALCMKGYDVPPQKPKKRIFLSRKGDNHYLLMNEDAVVQELKPYGFEVIHPGKMTLAEQVAYFGQAEIIAGTGTGLSNMVFAPQGTRIIQFQEPSKPIHALWTMSEALGHEYWCVMGETVPNPKDAIANISVPIDGLRQTIAAMGLNKVRTLFGIKL